MLDSPSSAAAHVLGWYLIDPANPNAVPTLMPLLSSTNQTLGTFKMSATFNPGGKPYGLYLTSPEHPMPNGTFFSQPQLNTGEADGLQHFAVFQQSATSYYIGIEDGYKAVSDLDYNDMVIQLSTAPAGRAIAGECSVRQSGGVHAERGADGDADEYGRAAVDVRKRGGD